jgi:two-component system sensor histidine kinase/response regulator
VALLIAWRGRSAGTGARDAELAQMSWRLEFALSASEVGVWDVDLLTDELMWDERARTLFGVTGREGFYGEADWLGALHPDDRNRALAAVNAALAGNGRFVTDYRVMLPDGQIRHLHDTAAVYRGGDGSRRLVGLVWDVTSEVSRQEELELRRAEAEAATRAKSQFLAAMSHEIRTPMSGVLGMLDLMLDDPLSDRQRERATIARASARGLLQILNDILDLSKLEAQAIQIRAESLRPRQVIREVMDLMAAGAEQKGLSLACQFSERVPEWVVADPMRLRQVLTNVVSNATKFTEAGRIAVRVDHARGALRVEVEDTGIGIPPEMCSRIFESFVQADTSLTRRSGGTGLGLAISKQLVELMGGRISVRSRPGAGSTFSFSIGAPPGVAPAAAVAPLPVACDLPPLRVLVAEDNATNQYLIRAHLEAAGHAVTTVENGAQAVSAVEAHTFDVVLMDIQMPEMDGPTAARAIRNLPGPAAHLPIVALTANALPGDRESYIAAGMSDYVSKPIDIAALHAALHRAATGIGVASPKDAA